MPKISEGRATARRNQVLDAALICFSRLGLDRATLRDISQESGLSLGTIYHYFRTKAELIEGIRQRSTEDEDAPHIEGMPSPDGREFFDFVVDFLFGRMQEPTSADSNRVAVMLWAHALLDDKTLAGQLGSLRRARERVWSDIAALQRKGLINPDLEPRYIGYVILGTLMGVQIQKTWEPELDGKKAAEVARAMLAGEFWRDGGKEGER